MVLGHEAMGYGLLPFELEARSSLDTHHVVVNASHRQRRSVVFRGGAAMLLGTGMLCLIVLFLGDNQPLSSSASKLPGLDIELSAEKAYSKPSRQHLQPTQTIQSPEAPFARPAQQKSRMTTNLKESCDERLLGPKAAGYRGCQDKTISGKVCQKWTSQSPHKHSRTPEKYPGFGLGDHNLCRNPDGEASIWCYTEDPDKRWEYCEPIPEPVVEPSKLFRVDPGTWDEVMAKCDAGGGTLASIHSEAEMKETKEICGDNICYIGLARWAGDQPFTWVDGTPVDFTAWDSAQPQASETKVVYTGPDGDKWHDWGTGADKFAGVCVKLAPTEADPEPENLQPGLQGSYYFFSEALTAMPQINSDKVPDATAVSERISFKSNDDFKAAVPDMPHDQVAAAWNGYIKIETAGLYTFKTVSDDGSHLWIKNTMVVDNSGLHGAAAKEGVINLAAGYFPVMADFFENGGGEYMEVFYSGPDTGGEEKLLEGLHSEGSTSVPVEPSPESESENTGETNAGVAEPTASSPEAEQDTTGGGGDSVGVAEPAGTAGSPEPSAEDGEQVPAGVDGAQASAGPPGPPGSPGQSGDQGHIRVNAADEPTAGPGPIGVPSPIVPYHGESGDGGDGASTGQMGPVGAPAPIVPYHDASRYNKNRWEGPTEDPFHFRKQKRIKREKQEAMTKQFFASMHHKKDEGFLEANKNALKVFHRTSNNMVGREWTGTLRPLRAPANQQGWAKWKGDRHTGVKDDLYRNP